MATYINIGASCAAFSEVAPPEISDVFLLTSTTVLKNAFSAGYSDAVSGSNLVTVSDFLFDIKFDKNLVYGATSKSTSRYLVHDTATGSFTPTAANNEIISASWSTWPTSATDTSSIRDAVYKGQTYTVVKSGNAFLIAAFRSLLAQTIQTYKNTPINVGSTGFYLRRVTPTASGFPVIDNNTDKKYLVLNGSGGLNELDIMSASVQASDITANQYKIVIDTSESGKYVLKIAKSSDNSILTGLTLWYDSSKFPTFSVRTDAGVSYCLDSIAPTDETAPSAATISTLIKYKNKYLAIESSSVVKLKDYWTSGYTLDQLRKNMMFLWTDLTPQSTSTIPGGLEEINRWNQQNTTTGNVDPALVVSLNSTTGALVINANTNLNEGWAITSKIGSDLGGSLIYVKAGSVVGFARASDASENVTFAAGLPTSVDNVWSCVKCSVLDTNNMCVS